MNEVSDEKKWQTLGHLPIYGASYAERQNARRWEDASPETQAKFRELYRIVPT